MCAVQETLLELCEEGSFFHESEEARRRRAKAVAIAKALELKQIGWMERLLTKKNA